MSQYTAIIIDDEAKARKGLQLLIKHFCPNITVLGSYGSVPESVIAINKKDPDIVFLDIEMPEYSGFELLGFFKEVTFEIIFVTAYNQYALKAFEVSAIDYLLKPIDGDMIKKAVEKATKRIGTKQMQQSIETLQRNTDTNFFRKIGLPVSDGVLFVKVDEIVYLQAEGAYTQIYLENTNKILVSKSMKYFEELLAGWSFFFRSHRSYLINVNFVKKFNRNEGFLMLDNKKNIPLARDRKSAFEKVMAKSVNAK